MGFSWIFHEINHPAIGGTPNSYGNQHGSAMFSQWQVFNSCQVGYLLNPLIYIYIIYFHL